MEMSDYYNKDEGSTAEEETLLLKRLIALKKQLEDDEPKLYKNPYNTKENIITNKNTVTSSKFKYRKVNQHVNKSLSTKIDNRDFKSDQNEYKHSSLFIKPDNSTLKVYSKSIPLCSMPTEAVTNKTNYELVKNNQNTEKHNLEINEIAKNSLVNNCKVLLNNSCKTYDISETILNIDDYIINVEDYITSSKYIVNKDDGNTLSTDQTNNHAKNVHVNRKFQNKLMSTTLLNSNTNDIANSLEKVKKVTSIIKKNSIKKFSDKLIESPNLIKIGKTKLIRRSLLRNKWKINNKPNSIENHIKERKPLSPLQYSTANTLTTYNKNNLLKVNNPTPIIKSKLSNSSNTNKLKWTRPNILLVDNVKNNNKIALVPKSDKLILFGKNKIIRQSLISSIKSKTKNYLLKHLSHRLALVRKLQLKNCSSKVKNINTSNEQFKNTLSLKKIENNPVEIKKNGKRSYSMYSYVNPTLRSKINNNFLENTESSNNKIRLSISTNKLQNSKIIKSNENKIQYLTKNKTLERIKNKKVLNKQLCLVFNRYGICSKLDQGKCDKRHYKKYITLCLKFLTGQCSKENCTLSHNIMEEKIPFCKLYLNSVCNQFNCPYLHEYRDKNTSICKNFLHGYCTLGKKCPNKHLNLCPMFQSKNKCPHGQKCLYPHILIDEKNTLDVEINEPRYFEITIPNINEENEKESIHIIPKRHAPLIDLPSYIPLK